MPFKSPFPPVPLETQPYGAANPTKKAMICAENPQFSVTYHEVYHHSLSVAAFLETQGFKKGDVLLTVLPNSWEFFEVLIGAALRGIIVSSASMLFTKYETEKQIQDSGATIVFCSDGRLERVLKATKNIDHVKKISGLRNHQL
uniref:AMP-binding domain-containing protein n=1 Tax=Panagrellus redivivus TaxID=6233 RepID=A0A7E4VAH5_PANRE